MPECGCSSILPQQQAPALPPLACIGHLLDEQHIFPSAFFSFLAIIGHFMPGWLPDVIGHLPSLQQSAFDPVWALSWLQQAHAFESCAGVVGCEPVCATDAKVRAMMMRRILSFMDECPSFSLLRMKNVRSVT